MKKSITFSLLFSCLFFISNAQLELELVEFASGFANPVDIVNAGDSRLFVVEKPGTIKVIFEDGTVNSNNFLDITGKVLNNQSERGLLGLAFHPNYFNNGFLYVNYTGSGGHTRISRFSVANDPNTVDPNSEVVLMTIDQPEWNHNGGCLRFGPDGYLYIGTGDGGSGGDPWGNAQNPNVLLGKMLRIDVDNGTPYGIPTDNPFVNDPNVRDEIWATGLRNPWRYSFDRETGDLWIGDVGQNAWEEVDFQPANSTGGENYGWKCNEGNHTFDIFSCDNMVNYVDPIHEYVNTNSVGRSITGGCRYRGSEYPSMYGHYFFGDFVSGRIWTLAPDGNGDWISNEWLNWTNNQLSTFGEDVNGEMYIAAYGQGRIYKVTEACQGLLPDGNVTDVSCFGEADGVIELEVLGGTAPFEINWSNGETGSTISNLSAGTYQVSVIDATGCVRTTAIEVAEPDEVVLSIEAMPMGETVLLSGVGFGPNANYQWYLNGDLVGTGLTYEATESGTYQIFFTDQNGCLITSEEIEVNLSSINEIEGLSQIEITPNPFESNFKLKLSTNHSLNLTMKILDISGKMIMQEQFQVNGILEKQINLSGFSSGVYLLYLETEEGKAVQRLIKE